MRYHTIYDRVETDMQDWGYFEPGSYCRMVYQADAKLNGKLIVQVEEIDDCEVTVYMMPNEVNQEKY